MKKYIGMLIAVGLCSSAWATIVNVSDDAWVLSTHGTSNFGAGTDLRVGVDLAQGRTYHDFLKFDLTGITETVTSATLNLRVGITGNANIDLGVYGVADDSWTELGITWNTQPAAGSLLDSHGAMGAGEWIVFDVTAAVAAAAAGDGFFSSMLADINEATTTVATYAAMDSSEFSDPARHPYLDIQTIPEPASIGLVALLGGAILGVRRFFLI